MKPYYEHAGITIYNCDWRGRGVDFADMLISDPPYGINYVHGGREGGKNPTKFGGVAVHGDNEPFDPSPFLGKFSKIVLWGANHYADKLPARPSWLVWDKRCNTVVNDQSDCELAWCNFGNTARVFYHIWDGFRRQTEKNIPRVHPTQKPNAVVHPEGWGWRGCIRPVYGKRNNLDCGQEFGTQSNWG